MAPPVLRLAVVKGPRSGETLHCEASNGVVRIGRIIKGNAFAVRDRGASESHLAFQFLPDLSRWAVSDLDTSNGTVVNEDLISPSTPFPLSHGDVIKIGANTSILVQIDESGGVEDRKGDGAGDTGLKVEAGRTNKRATRSKASVDVEEGSNLGRGARRATRSKGLVAQDSNDEVLDGAESEKEKGRGRRRKPAVRAAPARVLEDINEAPALVLGSEDLNVREKGDGLAIEGNHDVDVGVVAGEEGEKEGKRGRGRRRKAGDPARDLEEIEEAPILELRLEALNVAEKGDGLGIDGNDEMEVGGVAGEGVEKEEIERNEVVDMDKMTLEEWFDRMEKGLPQMINDVAVEMITDLKEKARKFEEFVAMRADEN